MIWAFETARSQLGAPAMPPGGVKVAGWPRWHPSASPWVSSMRRSAASLATRPGGGRPVSGRPGCGPPKKPSATWKRSRRRGHPQDVPVRSPKTFMVHALDMDGVVLRIESNSPQAGRPLWTVCEHQLSEIDLFASEWPERLGGATLCPPGDGVIGRVVGGSSHKSRKLVLVGEGSFCG